jgi:uncharacterized protein (TIGR02145 family)
MRINNRTLRALFLALALCLAAWCLSLSAAQASSGAGTLTDTRDGKTYRTMKIGKQTWMAENLNYRPQQDKTWCYENDTSYCKTWTAQILNYAEPTGSWCYNDSNSYCDKYGRLYDWNTARTACPSGWHLSTVNEWRFLYKTVRIQAGNPEIDWYKIDRKLKSKSGWNRNLDGTGGNGTDNIGFSALPGGSSNGGVRFFHVGEHGYWWADAGREKTRGYAHIMKYNRFGHIEKHYRAGYVDMYLPEKNDGISVRCVMDTTPQPAKEPSHDNQ